MPEAITATIGWSSQADPTRAGKAAAEQAWLHLSTQRPDLAIVFGSSWFDQQSLLQGVLSVLGDVPLIGGSTAGEIVPTGPISHSCVVLLLASKTQGWSTGFGQDIDRTPREAAQQAAQMALRDFRATPRRGFLIFGDGLITNYADVLRGIQEALGTSFLVVGGMMGDDLRFKQTYQYIRQRALNRSVVGALIGGSVKIGFGIEHGFAPISKPRQITKAHSNILVELDHKPASSVYEEYFGTDLVGQMKHDGLSRQGIAYPLGIMCEANNQWLLRNVVSFQDDGSLACSAHMPENSWLQLMIGNRELVLEAAHRAAQQAIQSLNQVACVLVFDSIARRKLLGERGAAAEIACIRQVIGASIPMAGCYTYGEQAPFSATAAYGGTVVQTASVLVVAMGV